MLIKYVVLLVKIFKLPYDLFFLNGFFLIRYENDFLYIYVTMDIRVMGEEI